MFKSFLSFGVRAHECAHESAGTRRSRCNVGRDTGHVPPPEGSGPDGDSLDRGYPGCRVRSTGASRRRDSRRTRRRRPLAAARRGARDDRARASCSRSSIPARSTGSPPGCRPGVAVISATNGKTTTAAMAAEILRPRFRLAHNHSGANLVSGVASTLLAATGAELGLLEVDEGALPEVLRRVRPRAVCLGNLFRDQLDRYGELELIAERWREAVSELRDGTVLVLNGDDPQVGDLAPAHGASSRPRRPARSRGRRSSTPPTRSTASAAARRTTTPPPTSGHLGDYRCPNCGHARPRARRRRARRSSCTGSSAPLSTSSRPEGTRRVELALPGPLQRLQRARRGGARARARRVARRDRRRARRFSAAFGRFERIAVDEQAAAAAPDQEPGRRERGRCARWSTAAAPRRRHRLERRDRRRPRRLVDLGRRLRAAARRARHASSSTGDRAAELALRFKYGGLDEARDRGRAGARARARPRARADARRRRARRAADLHGDARAAADRRGRGHREAVLGASGVRRSASATSIPST